jgi:hypothetical protein
LTLLKDKTRVKSALSESYAEREDEEDDRFVHNWARMQAIATSGGQNDSGMFEMNFRDERYLPFEGAGAISRWRIEMDPESNGFDFNTLADVVLHIRYSARDGGQRLKEAAKKALADAIGEEATKPQARLFSLRHEFSTSWHQLIKNEGPGLSTGTFTFTKDRFPFLFRSKELTAGRVALFAVLKDGVKTEVAGKLSVTLTPPASPEVTIKFRPRDQWRRILAPNETPEANRVIANAPADATWKLTADSRLVAENVEDLLFVCEYSVANAG